MVAGVLFILFSPNMISHIISSSGSKSIFFLLLSQVILLLLLLLLDCTLPAWCFLPVEGFFSCVAQVGDFAW